jgi:hypothetical protein
LEEERRVKEEQRFKRLLDGQLEQIRITQEKKDKQIALELKAIQEKQLAAEKMAQEKDLLLA